MTQSQINLITHIEELAANAWPPAVMQAVDGWRLRFTDNVTRRANSVWPNGVGREQHRLLEKLAWVESFYARRGCPARFQLCPAAQPNDLDTILSDRGYISDARTAVQIVDLSTVITRTKRDAIHQVIVSETFDEAWFNAYCEAEEVDACAATVRRGILQRIGPRVGYAHLRIDGRSAGMGLAVMERGWVGIFSMATHPDFRRRGYATAVIHALADWGQTNQAERIYLQVMDRNKTAQALYAKLGFEALYHYHYRELVV